VTRTRVKEDNHVGGTKKDDTPQLWPFGHPVLPWPSISLTLVFIDKEKLRPVLWQPCTFTRTITILHVSHLHLCLTETHTIPPFNPFNWLYPFIFIRNDMIRTKSVYKVMNGNIYIYIFP
jgi:hypothetical protein